MIVINLVKTLTISCFIYHIAVYFLNFNFKKIAWFNDIFNIYYSDKYTQNEM